MIKLKLIICIVAFYQTAYCFNNLEINKVDSSAMLFFDACLENKIQIVEKMLDEGFDFHIFNNDGRTPIEIALLEGNYNIYNLLFNEYEKLKLLDRLQEIDLIDITIMLGEIGTLKKLLLQEKTDMIPIKTTSERLQKAIFFAKSFDYMKKRTDIGGAGVYLHRFDTLPPYSHFQVIDLLLSHGYNLNEVDEQRQTVLFLVKENFDLIKFLVERNINLNIVNNEGKTFLEDLVIDFTNPIHFFGTFDTITMHYSSFDTVLIQNKFDIIFYLLQNTNAKINSLKFSNEFFVLKKIIDYENYDLLNFLKKRNFNFDKPNLDGKTIFNYIDDIGNKQLKHILFPVRAHMHD
jgi:ankyrin repeat protein